MTYNKLQSILPNDELHYSADCTQFAEDNGLSMSSLTDNHKFIVFSETCDYWTATIAALDANSIKYVVKKDEWNLDYILI